MAYITVARNILRLILWPGSCLLFMNGGKDVYAKIWGGIIVSLLD